MKINITITHTHRATGTVVMSKSRYTSNAKAMKFLKSHARFIKDSATGTKKKPEPLHDTAVVIIHDS